MARICQYRKTLLLESQRCQTKLLQYLLFQVFFFVCPWKNFQHCCSIFQQFSKPSCFHFLSGLVTDEDVIKRESKLRNALKSNTEFRVKDDAVVEVAQVNSDKLKNLVFCILCLKSHLIYSMCWYTCSITLHSLFPLHDGTKLLWNLKGNRNN